MVWIRCQNENYCKDGLTIASPRQSCHSLFMNARLFSLAIGLLCLVAKAAEPDWKEMLGPSKAEPRAAASFTLTWRINLASALAEARADDRPVFVTFRCLPCKQCAF